MRYWWFLILPGIIFSVSLIDLFATLYFKQTNMGFSEANPIARYIWDTRGDAGLIIFKLVVTLVSCVCMGMVIKTKTRCWIMAVSVFGLFGCILLVGWWIFWIFIATA